MARRYSKSSQDSVEKEMHEFKRGKARSGRGGRKVKSREQAIAIGLSKARKKGAKVPKKPSSSRTKSQGTRRGSKGTSKGRSSRSRSRSSSGNR